MELGMTPFFKKILIILAAFVVLLQADVDCRVLRAPKSSGKSPTLFGAAAGPIYVDGVQYPGLYGAVENPYYEAIHVPANTPTTIWTSQLNPVQAGGIAGANALFIEYDRSDPLISIDAGQASGWIYRKVEGTVAGGAFCNDSNPSICATSTATTGIDYSTADPGNGPQGIVSTCTAPFLWNGSNFVTVLTCPVAVFAQIGWVTGFGGKAPPAFDAGPGSPPTIVSLYVPIGSQSGGETIAFAGTGFTGLNSSYGDFGGIAATSPTVVSSTLFTDDTPTSGLTVSSSPISATVGASTGLNFYVTYPYPLAMYFAGTTTGGIWANDWALTSSNVTSWADQSGHGSPLTSSGCSHTPTVQASYNSSSYNAGIFPGSTNATCLRSTIDLPDGGTSLQQPFTTWTVYSTTSASATQVISDGIGSSNAAELYISAGTYGLYAGSPSATFGTVVANTTYFVGAVFSGSTSAIYANGTLSGNLSAGTDTLTGETLGASYAVTSGCNCYIQAHGLIGGALSSANFATLKATLSAAIGGTALQ
jgi:hypothetical protein